MDAVNTMACSAAHIRNLALAVASHVKGSHLVLILEGLQDFSGDKGQG